MKAILALAFLVVICSANAPKDKQAAHFGHGMREHFLMSPNTVNLNNGAFGTGAKVAYEAFDVI
jgi:hypothetical protein